MTQTQTQRGSGGPGRGLLARFARDTRGGFATMLAVAAIPLIAMAGVGVDVARVLSARTDLQAATDNAALALARYPVSGQGSNSSASGSCPDTTASNNPKAPTSFQTQACKWVLTNFNRNDASNLVVTPTSTAAQVTVGANVDVTTTLSGIIGFRTIHVAVTSVVNRNVSHIEIALVLDNTYSMNQDNKIGTLKSAANDLVSSLSQQAIASGDPNSLKIAVVPFASAVNVGTTYQNATWMSHISPYSSAAENWINDPAFGNDRILAFTALGTSWYGCVEDRPMPYDILDAPPVATTPASLFTPYFAPDEPDDASVTPAMPSNWYGWTNSYIKDSSTHQPDFWSHYTDTAKYLSHTADTSSNNSKQFWAAIGQSNFGPNFGCGTQALLRLTPITSASSTTAITNEINAMTPYGATYIPIGLVWGWHVLSPNAPFSDGASYTATGTAKATKIIVLVTDGTNTYQQNDQQFDPADLPGFVVNTDYLTSTYSSIGYAGVGVPNVTYPKFRSRIAYNGPTAIGQSANPDYSKGVKVAMDDRLAKLCQNIKNANTSNPIIIYTVPVEVSDTNTKGLLQACATDSNHYIDATSTSALTTAFQNIAGQISALRVAQ